MSEIANEHSFEFYSLTPDLVLDAVEQGGFEVTGHYLQLNSYENRVYDIQLEPQRNDPALGERVIAKLYRPGRWDQSAVQEEHDFIAELKENGVPAVAPWPQKDGGTLSLFHNIIVALFPKQRGRIPQELQQHHFKQIGRTLARLHNVGAQTVAAHRPLLNTVHYGWNSLDILSHWVAPEVWPRYEKSAKVILNHLDEALDESQFIRIHGDCHKGNLLMTDEAGQDQEFFFVDFDDFCNGPPAQDFWMLFSGNADDSKEEQDSILSGYDELREITDEDLNLMTPLRGLRIIHYAAWIARRWADPTFPQLFPLYRDYIYWAEETEALEKIAWSI